MGKAHHGHLKGLIIMAPKRRKIFLIGYRATGKSSVGRELARIMGCSFLDLDNQIEAAAGATIAEIVEKNGWDHFRAMEKRALKEAIEKQGSMVIACGGGIVLHPELMEAAKRTSVVVWLTAPIDVMKRRIASDSTSATRRPSLSGDDIEKEISEILKQREPLYRKFSHFEIDTFEKGPFQLAREISEATKYAR